MASDIGSIVSERAQGKGVLVGILALGEQLANEIAAAHVVNQVAEFDAAEGIVAKVLDDGAAIGISVCFRELGFCESGKALEEKRAKITGPRQVHDFLVGEHGVGERASGAQEQGEKRGQNADTPWAAATGSGT
jgi:hypothetical protein